jgi:hypothetical protein
LLPIIIITLIGIIGLFPIVEENNKAQLAIQKELKKAFIIGLTLLISFSLLNTIIPDKNTMYLIAGIYLGKTTAKELTLGDKAKKVAKLVDLNLDKTIKELEREIK